jgi:hypothetical protein
MNLKSIVTADLSQLERKYGEAISASKRTASQMDAAFKDSPKLDPRSLSAGMSGAATQIKASNDIIKESVESVSSEIIESFGIDGDVVNMLANEMVKLKLSTLAAGGAAAGLVIGIGLLTNAMAKTGAEIRNVAQLTGLSTDQVQRYEAAASAAGVATDVFTDAIAKLRDRAKDATRGNIEVAQAFQALGVSAEGSVRNAASAFERLLDILEQVPDAQTRIMIAQRVLGDVNDQTLSGILALTDANGQLRDRVNELSVALDKQSVEELAQMNREWDLLSTKLGNFSKQVGLGTVKTLEYIGLALAGETDKMNQAGGATSSFSQQQNQATSATNTATGAIQNQTAAVAALTAELASVRIGAIQKGVSEQLTQIAFSSRNAAEAVSEFKKRLARDDDFYAAVNRQKQYKDSLEALNKLIDPDKPRARRATGDNRAKEISELEQLTRQLQSTNRDISVFGNLTSKEFKLRMELEGAREFKSGLEEILKLRRSLGEPIRTPFPQTTEGIEAEIAKLNALKTARDALARQDIYAGIRQKVAAEAEERRKVLESFDQVQRELREMSGDEIENIGIDLGERFAEAMANAIREGRGDIVDAINEIIRQGKERARVVRDTERARDVTSIAESGLEQARIMIQNDLNRGIITEIEARQQQVEAERDARTAILQALEAERELAIARGDAAEAARLAVEIERAQSLGEGINERFEQFRDRLGQGFDDIIGTLMRGGEGLREAGMRVVNDVFNTLIQEMLLQATGGKYGSFGQLIGGALGGLLGGLFKAEGGPVSAGMPYIIGEEGPEMFVPRTSGYVMDAQATRSAMSRSSTMVNVTNVFHVATPGGQISRESQSQAATKAAAAVEHAVRRNA